MDSKVQDNNKMATAPLGKLMTELAVPTVFAQLVNLLYNMVDRIYVGRIPEEGHLALAGLGVCSLKIEGRMKRPEYVAAATAAMAGRTVRVLVEAAGRNEGTVNGRLDNNLVVEFKAPESLIGQWADVHITGSRAALLVGELAE